MNQLSDGQLTRLVADADPLPAGGRGPTIEGAWARIDAELSAGPDAVVVPLRRRRRRLAILGAVIAAVVALTAAAPFIATRTGVWNAPEWISAGGPGELYRLNGSDFPEQIDQLTTDIPFPDEASHSAYLAWMVYDAADSGDDTAATTGALRAEMARGAICAWADTWQAAHASGDTAAEQRSSQALADAVNWPAVTDVDPHPSTHDKTPEGVITSTVFGYLPEIAAAAADGSAQRVDSMLEKSSFCQDIDVTPVDRAAPYPSPPVAVRGSATAVPRDR